jgi:hypothetical protein
VLTRDFSPNRNHKRRLSKLMRRAHNTRRAITKRKRAKALKLQALPLKVRKARPLATDLTAEEAEVAVITVAISESTTPTRKALKLSRTKPIRTITTSLTEEAVVVSGEANTVEESSAVVSVAAEAVNTVVEVAEVVVVAIAHGPSISLESTEDAEKFVRLKQPKDHPGLMLLPQLSPLLLRLSEYG